MTEDEAKTKPCIGPRPELTGEVVPGERPGSVVMWACRGSDCLAWRAVGAAIDNEGYCGLAGQP